MSPKSRKAAAAVEPPSAAGDAAASRAPAGLPDAVRLQHTHVTCGPDINMNVRGWEAAGEDRKQGRVFLCGGEQMRRLPNQPPPHPHQQTDTVTSALAYMALGVDNSWSLDEFKARLGVRVTGPPAGAAPPDPLTLTFDVVGVDASLANALRRILLAEVPTVAIEHVFMVDNTSVIPCEILAHRLGLVPLAVDAAALEPRAAGAPATDANTVVFSLKAACTRGADGGLVGDRVTSGDLAWLPAGSAMPAETGAAFTQDQGARLPGGAAPVHGDILLARLGAGQAVEAECHAVVGTGAEHAKWSPVATAWYRLHPEVAITAPITGDDADALAAALPGLVAVDGAGAGRRAVVAAPARGAEKLLEKARRLSGEAPYEGRLEVRRVKDHFIFTVESVGALPPATLVTRALDVLAAKCDRLLERV